MLPTLPIPSTVASPRASEPASNADNPGGEAFAQALQRARGEPRPAHGSASPAQPRQATDGGAHPTSGARSVKQDGASETVDEARSDVGSVVAAAAAADDDTTSADASARGHDAAPGSANAVIDATVAPTTPPIFAFDAPRPAAAVADAPRVAPQAAADDDTSAAAIDGHAAARSGSRAVAHDLRAAPATPGRLAVRDDRAADDTTVATAQTPHAALERTVTEGGTQAALPMRAATFEASALDATAPPTAQAAPVRDGVHLATPRDGTSTLPQATLHAAIDEPGFGAAVGQQVALWVRDGAQEARLQLNPAELGPVTVQIALQGQAAHVDFTAAVAATRESIEQSLPALAAALRESGFTLAGGGVSSGSGQRSTDRQREHARVGGVGNRSRNDAGADSGHAVVARPQRWTRSLVDVYA